MNGFTSELRIDFEEDLIVIVLSNISITPVSSWYSGWKTN